MRPLLANIATLMRASLPNTIKRIVVGKDDSPKMSDLPQVQIYPENTQIQLSGTVKDNQTRVVTIRVVDSVKSKLSQSSVSIGTVSSMLAVCDFIEKKEASGAFSTTSVLGILRNNISIAGQGLYQDNINVNYSDLEKLEFPNVVAETQVEFHSRNLTT